MDSSSLAALAAGRLGKPVWTLSLLPPRERAASLAHERSYIEPLAERYGFARRWELFHHPTLIPDIWPAAPRAAFHVLHPVLCSLPAILREAPVRVLFGGEYADNVVGSPGFTGPDWARHTPPAYFLAHPEVLLKAPRNLARYAKHRLTRLLGRPVLPFPEERLDTDPLTGRPLGLFRPELAEEYRAWWRAQRRALLADDGPWAWLWLDSLYNDAWVPMNWEACSALGVRRSIPFFSRGVFELVFACHPTELYGPGPKKLLRAALKGHVPERNLFRPDKGGFAAYARQVQRAWQGPGPEDLPEELAPLLRPGWLERPPKTVSYFQHRALTRLLVFLEAVWYNQTGKGSPADTPPVALPLESITQP
ncbi:MAG: asparagine synthase-related protein [Ardenticatenia bacterium]|nr:asparagine synthase-related protein [Ardenticatenia bacterium]